MNTLKIAAWKAYRLFIETFSSLSLLVCYFFLLSFFCYCCYYYVNIMNSTEWVHRVSFHRVSYKNNENRRQCARNKFIVEQLRMEPNSIHEKNTENCADVTKQKPHTHKMCKYSKGGNEYEFYCNYKQS